MRIVDVLIDAGRPIAYHAGLARALGSIPAALMLTQLLYWSDKTRVSDGWVHKVERDWDEELALAPKQLKGARAVLVGLGLVEHERHGMPAKPYYRVDTEALEQWWEETFSPDKTGQKGRTRPAKRAGQDRPKGPDNTSSYIDDGIDDGTSPGFQTLLGTVDPPPPPTKPARQTKPKATKELTRSSVLADALAKAEWERRTTKPVIGFPAFRARIQEVLEAGHSEQAVAKLLPTMTVFSRNAWDFALGGGTKGQRSPTAHLPANDQALQDPNYWGDPQ